MTADSEPKRTTFYKIPDRLRAYKWAGQSVGICYRKSLDSQGRDLYRHPGRPVKGDWVIEDFEHGVLLFVCSDQWLSKFYEIGRASCRERV